MEPQVIISKSEYDELMEMKSKFNELFKKYTVVERIEIKTHWTAKIGVTIATTDEVIKQLNTEIEAIKDTYSTMRQNDYELGKSDAHRKYKRIFGNFYRKTPIYGLPKFDNPPQPPPPRNLK